MAEQNGEGQDSAAPDGEMSLGDFVGDVFGDVPESEESQPVATSDAAGTPPAERQQATGEVKSSPEGTEKPERSGTPPPDAANPVLDKGEPKTTEADSDPLATATPFTYPVNGQDKTFDGIKVLGDSGAIITSEALPLLAQKLSDAERFHQTSREQYDQIRDYERLSEWKTQGEDGKEVTVSGREGLIAQRTSFAALEASFNTLVSAFKPDAQGNYKLLSDLVDVDPATNKIIVSPTVLENLLTKAELAETRAIQGTQSRLAAITAPKTSGPSAGQATPQDFSQAAPQIIEQAAKQAGIDSKTLTEKDRAFLVQQFPRYIRQVTEADRAESYSLKIGSPIVDAGFAQVVKDRADMRKEIGATAIAASNAAKENATKLAAAAIGQRTPVTPSTSRTQERTPEDTRVSDADKAWALRERLSGGKFSTT